MPIIYHDNQFSPRTLYFFDNPQKPINQINIVAVYFVPRDRQKDQINNWRDILEKNLSSLQKFHELQFQGHSNLSYSIYDSPITGEQDGKFYDTDDTNKGNPEALRQVAAEVERRLLTADGDLKNEKFNNQILKSDYQTLIILYEGVGASGAVGEPAALISRKYFSQTDDEYSGTTTMAHEFYHTLGIPDGYKEEVLENYGLLVEKLTTQDIMGSGRTISLDKTYLSRETLQHFGLQ